MTDYKNKKKFDTVVGMYSDLDLDPNDWVNKEQKDHYFNKKKLERTTQNVRYYPKELDKITLTCRNNHTFTPNWLEKRFPSMPFRLRDGQLLQPITAQVKCSICDESTDISLPANSKYLGDVNLYGDEAIRDFNEKIIMSYSFVSQPRKQDVHLKFKSEFLALKKELVPQLPPDKWALHYMNLMNDGQRERINYLSSLTKNDVLIFSKKLGDIISKYPNQLVKWNCTGYTINLLNIKKSKLES